MAGLLSGRAATERKGMSVMMVSFPMVSLVPVGVKIPKWLPFRVTPRTLGLV